MALTPILLGFTPVISAPSAYSNEWDVTAEIDDPTERFSGFDVAVNDVVFVDLRASTSAPGMAGRYVIKSLLSLTASTVRIILKWGGDGDGIDPVEGAGQRGFLSKPSERNGLVWLPSSRVLQIPQEFVEASRNAESFNVVDKFASTILGTVVDQVARDRQVRSLTAMRTFTLGQVVTRRGGVTDLACPQNDLKMPAVGIALGMGSGSVLIQSHGIVTNPAFSFEPGLPLYVSDVGGLTQDASSVTKPGWLQFVGMALDTNMLDLSFTGEMRKR